MARSAASGRRSTKPAPRAGAKLVVALDGPASSGKSSVGVAAAEALRFRFLDTGLLYRALTALALREGVAVDDAAGLVALVGRVGLEDDGGGRLTRVLLDGADATDEARGHAVDAAVSAVARVPEVRAALMPRQRELADAGRIVVAGRDIGTVVLPDAGLKLFLDASVEERAQRRIDERGLHPASPEAAEVREHLRARDAQDRSRAVAPLRPAPDAVILHTDGNTREQTIALVVDAIRSAATRDVPPPRPEPAAAGESPPPPAPSAEPGTGPVPERAEPSRRRARRPARRGGLETLALSDAAIAANDQSIIVRMVALLARIAARLFADIRFEGFDRIPRDGAVILAINHISNADPVVVGAWVTPLLRRRRIHWLAKRELFGWPVLGWLAAHGGVHPVDRSTADIEAYRLATRILEAGYVLLIFPEGTRSPSGSLQEAKDGVATLALRSDATIVPIGVNNSDAVWPRGRMLPRPIPRRRVTVRVGEPFRAADIVPEDADRRAAKVIATRGIMGRIAALLDERHRGVYADAVGDAAVPSS